MIQTPIFRDADHRPRDGAAFAAMRRGAMVVAFVGDVGIDEGAAYEALRTSPTTFDQIKRFDGSASSTLRSASQVPPKP